MFRKDDPKDRDDGIPIGEEESLRHDEIAVDLAPGHCGQHRRSGIPEKARIGLPFPSKAGDDHVVSRQSFLKGPVTYRVALGDPQAGVGD